MLKVSIITVCFNSAQTIEETLRSVTQQDYPLIEYIIIDGGSTDDTLKIIQSYQQQIDHVISESDEGIYDAMNKGIQLASGDIIGLLNADDIYASREIISQVVKQFQDPQIQACYGDLIYFSNANPEKIYRYWQSSPFVPGLFAKGWCPPHPTFFVRKQVYERYGRFNTTYSMGNDVELMMRFLEKFQIKSVYLSRVLVKMRLGGISNRGLKNIVTQNQCVLKAAKELSIPISTWRFVCCKIGNRVWQILRARVFA